MVYPHFAPFIVSDGLAGKKGALADARKPLGSGLKRQIAVHFDAARDAFLHYFGLVDAGDDGFLQRGFDSIAAGFIL